MAERERDAMDTMSPLAMKQRAVLADQMQMGISEAAMAWQRDYLKRGAPVGWTPDQNMIQELTYMNEQTQKGLVEAIREGVSEGIGRLLEVK